MSSRPLPTFFVLFAVAALVAVLALYLGEGDLGHPRFGDTFLRLRALRLSAAFVAGGSLAAAGVLIQGLFRNPLASPSVLGTTSGATLGGQLALILASSFPSLGIAPQMLLPIGCVFGALFGLFLLLVFLRRGARLLVLLLIGFALTSLFTSTGSFFTMLAQEQHELGRAVVAFTLGGLGGVGPAHVRLALPLMVFSLVAAFLWARPLDLLLSGDDEAATLGVDVVVTRRWAVVWAGVLTAAAVAIGGNIAFVGLVVPHALRPFVGAGHRWLLLASVIGGGAFVAACDLIARLVPASTEVPLGVVSGLIGAPLFVFMLLRTQRGALDG